MYHSLADGRCPDRQFPKFTTTRARLTAQLGALRAAGYRLESVAGLLALLDRGPGGGPPPAKLCVMTVDDGHRSALDMAELFAAHGANATFFLTADYCAKRPDFLRPEEIVDLARRGFDCGAHGVTHRPLAELPAAAMREELAASKAWLEGILGRPVESMSLPAGRGNRAVYRTAFALGYRVVGNSIEWPNGGAAPPRRLNRFVVEAGCDERLVLRLAAGDLAYAGRRRLRAALLWLPKRVLRPHHKLR